MLMHGKGFQNNRRPVWCKLLVVGLRSGCVGLAVLGPYLVLMSF